jgi:nucleoside-diphosphate-sugar epimerase
MNILVTGACGYKGNVLVPKLLDAGHSVIAFDIMWFGNDLRPHGDLKVIQGDVRNIAEIPLEGVDAIIHLSSVANDPAGDLDPKLTWEISALATMQLIDRAARLGIKHFIYASSGSVYGLKDEAQVTEDLTLVPLSEYNKTKMVAERVVLSYSNQMTVQVVRPATVCGISPRMRFDVVVNMFVMHAFRDKMITVLGGDQVRPNIHIRDMSRVYEHFLNNPRLASGCYNAGFENISVMSIAEMVAKKFGVEIEIKPSNDPRSYRQDSTKLRATGYTQSTTVADAIEEIADALQSGKIKDDDRWYTVKWMTANQIGDAK